MRNREIARISKERTMKKFSKAQEEMMGFVLIVVIIAIFILIFVAFMISRPEKQAVESFEAESFVQSLLQYTTDCRDNLEFLSIESLINKCQKKEKCLDERDTCNVLEKNIKEIISKSWDIQNSPIKGYSLAILSNKQELLKVQEGNSTSNSIGAVQSFVRSGIPTEINFEVFYYRRDD